MGKVTTERLGRDIASMRGDTYPDARWVPPNDPARSGFWSIPLRVKPQADQLERIVSDLENDRIVDLSTNGKLLAVEGSEENHAPVLELEAIQKHFDAIPDVWEARIVYPSDDADPKAWLQPSWWGPQVINDHEHINADMSACVFYAPAEKAWNPNDQDLSQYVDQLAIWVLKSEVWIARGANTNLVGWPGASQSHELHVLLRASIASRCQCGLGIPYGTCCRPRHMKELMFSGAKSVVVQDQHDWRSPLTVPLSLFQVPQCTLRGRPKPSSLLIQ